jgi:hypothetical protein
MSKKTLSALFILASVIFMTNVQTSHAGKMEKIMACLDEPPSKADFKLITLQFPMDRNVGPKPCKVLYMQCLTLFEVTIPILNKKFKFAVENGSAILPLFWEGDKTGQVDSLECQKNQCTINYTAAIDGCKYQEGAPPPPK